MRPDKNRPQRKTPQGHAVAERKRRHRFHPRHGSRVQANRQIGRLVNTIR